MKVLDLSPHGCRIECIERSLPEDRLWLKFKGLEALQATICWVDGFVAGVEFETPIHSAVFDRMLSNLRG